MIPARIGPPISRRGGRISRLVVLALALPMSTTASGVLTAETSAASTAPLKNTLTWNGKYTYSHKYTNSVLTTIISWKLDADPASAGVETKWKWAEMSGTISETGGGRDCSASMRPNPLPAPGPFILSPVSAYRSPGEAQFTVGMIAPTALYFDLSAADPRVPCSTPYESAAAASDWDGLRLVVSLPAGTSVVPVNRSSPKDQGIETYSIESTLRFSGGVPINAPSILGSPKVTQPEIFGPPKETPKDVRAQALAQMKQEFNTVVYPCLVAAAGAATLAVPSVAIQLLLAGPLVVLGTPLCLRIVTTIKYLEGVYNDPPILNFTQAATVPDEPPPPVNMPACPVGPAKVAALCSAFQAAGLDYLAQTQKVTNVAAALETTIGRESAAGNAKDATSVALQQQTAQALLPQLTAAVAARKVSGRQLAAVLTRAGVKRISVPAARTAVVYASVLKSLAEQGIPEAEIRAAVGNSLKPTTIDVLNAFSA